MSRYFAAIDPDPVGITAVSARWEKNGDCTPESFCRVPSKGFARGEVVDLARASDSVIEVMEKLRENTGKVFQDIYAGVSSSSIRLMPSSGMILLSRYGREINPMDVKKCEEIASTVRIPLDRARLHRLVKGFSVDGDGFVKNPLNLEGVKLSVDMNIFTVNASVTQNMSKCISQAGFVPAGFVFSALAAANRAVLEEARQEGALFLGIHKEVTEAIVFCERGVADCRVFASDTAWGEGRDDAVLEKISDSIRSLSGWDSTKKAVVIGECALMDGVIERLETLLGIPVAAGTCAVRPLEDLPASRAGYIGVLGMLDHFQEERHRTRAPGSGIQRITRNITGFLDKSF